MNRRYTLELPTPHSNSHHQDYSNLVGNPNEPSSVTVTGLGGRPKAYFSLLVGDWEHFFYEESI